MKRLVTILLLVMVISPVWCRAGQGAEIKELLSGGMFPLTMQLKDLDGSWRRVSISMEGDMGGTLGLYATISSPNGGAYYTRGDTVVMGDQTFLVAYRPQATRSAVAEIMFRAPRGIVPDKLTAGSTLALALVSQRAITSINDVRPFNLQREIADSANAAAKLEELTRPPEPRGVAEQQGPASSLENLKQLGLAALMYARDYDDVLPPLKDAATARQALWLYVKNPKAFFHPVTNQAYLPNPFLSGKRLRDVDDPQSTIIFYEAAPAADGTRGAAFVNGRIKLLTPGDWERCKNISKIP